MVVFPPSLPPRPFIREGISQFLNLLVFSARIITKQVYVSFGLPMRYRVLVSTMVSVS